MALLSVIRRWAFRDRISIREISRRTGLSRNTIRRYLRSDEVEPRFKVPDRPSNLDPFAEKLAYWLKVEAGRSRKQKRTIKQLHADLVTLGYDGSYPRSFELDVVVIPGGGGSLGVKSCSLTASLRCLFRLCHSGGLGGRAWPVQKSE